MADGDTTEVGHVIAYLSLDNTAWSRAIEQAKRDLRELDGKDAVVRLRLDDGDAEAKLRVIDRQLSDLNRRSPEVKVKTDAKQTTAQFSLLRDSILLLGSAAVPIAGVLAGSVAGLAPTLAVVALGVKGIADEMKAGGLQGTQYGQDISAAKSELQQLKTISAGGLLNGIDSAMQQSAPLFGQVNRTLGEVSGQFGVIAGDTAPALLAVLNDLEPLFTAIGGELEKGAASLDHWATSGKGVQGFVVYVQANLPLVEHTIGDLITLVSHLAQGLAPMGTASLSAFGTIIDLLNRLPIGVLRVLLPLIVATRVAMLSYAGVNAVINGVGRAYSALTSPIQSAAASAKATALQTQAAAAHEAAAVAEAKAEEAAAAQEAAIEIAAAAEESNSVLAAGAAASAEAAIEFAAAMQAEAEAAQAAAAEIADAAAAATAAVETEAVGLSGMLGPLAAVGAGLGIFGALLLGSGSDAETAARAVDDYTESVKKSTDAENEANLQATTSALAKKGAYQQLDHIMSLNTQTGIGLGLSYNDLTQAVNGSNDQFNETLSVLQSVADQLNTRIGNGGITRDVEDQKVSVLQLIDTLKAQRSGLGQALTAQEAMNEANRQGGTAAAEQAAKIEQLDADLKSLAQTQLAAVQSEDAFREGLLGVSSAVKQNGDSLSKNTKGGLANRDMIVQLLGQAVSLAQAQRKNGESVDKVTVSLANNVRQIEHTATAAGLSKAQVDALIKSMGLTPKDIGTKFDVDTRTVPQKIADAQSQIDALRQKAPTLVGVDQAQALADIVRLQEQIDALRGKTVQINVNTNGGSGQIGGGHSGIHISGTLASGGKVRGPGTGTSDTAGLFALSNGEFVSTADATSRNHEALEAANRGAVLAVVGRMANGGPIGDVTGSAKAWKFAGQTYSTEREADNARRRAIVAEIKLLTTIDDKGLKNFEAALNGTAQQAQAAFATLAASLKQADVPASVIRHLQELNTNLDRVAAHRDRLRAQLGSAPSAPTAYDRLATAQQDYSNEKSSVTNTAESGFDVGKAAAADGSVSFASTNASAIQYANLLTAFYNGLQKLAAGVFGKSSTGRAMLQKLREEGPGAYPQVKALLSGTPAEDKSLIATQSRIDSEAARLGTSAANAGYGAELSSAKAAVNRLKAEISIDDRSINRIAGQIEKGVERAVARIKVQIDGKKAGKAVTTGNNRNRRRN